MPTLAAIDVGSHAVRLSVVRLSPIGAISAMEFQRWPIRLGADVFSYGHIRDNRQRALLGVFEDIAQQMGLLGVEAYRAVATAALRDAHNGKRIVEHIRRTSGVHVEIISGIEEGRLSRDALLRALGSVPKGTLLVDLGGGSLEVHRARCRWGRSLPLGTVRLLERYPVLLATMTRAELSAVGREIRADLERRLASSVAPMAIGTGGNLGLLARLAPRKGFHPTINIRRLGHATRRIAAMSAHARVHQLGLRPDRADVIVPAALVIVEIARLFAVPSLVVPGTGLRETILFGLAHETVTSEHARTLVHRLQRRASGRAPIARLALRLFDELAPAHGLWPPARAPLLCAAHLHAGGFVTPDDRHLSELGLDERSRYVAAFAAAAAANKGSVRFLRAVDRDDGRAAEILGAILRLACVLVERRIRDVVADLSTMPIQVRAGLRRSLSPAAAAPLEEALGFEVRVR